MKKILTVCMLLSIVFVVSCDNKEVVSTEEYNKLIDNLFSTKGLEIEMNASAYGSEVDKDFSKNLGDDALVSETSINIMMDSSKEHMDVYSHVIDISSEQKNETIEIIKNGTFYGFLKNDETSDFIYSTDDYKPTQNEIIDKFKGYLFYIDDDAKEAYTVHKEKNKNDTIYTINLNKDSELVDSNIKSFDCKAKVGKDNYLKSLSVSIKTFFQDPQNEQYYQTEYITNVKLKNVDDIPEIDFSLIDGISN